jgi:hypothetical protein
MLGSVRGGGCVCLHGHAQCDAVEGGEGWGGVPPSATHKRLPAEVPGVPLRLAIATLCAPGRVGGGAGGVVGGRYLRLRVHRQVEPGARRWRAEPKKHRGISASRHWRWRLAVSQSHGDLCR